MAKDGEVWIQEMEGVHVCRRTIRQSSFSKDDGSGDWRSELSNDGWIEFSSERREFVVRESSGVRKWDGIRDVYGGENNGG